MIAKICPKPRPGNLLVADGGVTVTVEEAEDQGDAEDVKTPTVSPNSSFNQVCPLIKGIVFLSLT